MKPVLNFLSTPEVEEIHRAACDPLCTLGMRFSWLPHDAPIRITPSG
jgi:hypothetical protein